MPREVVELQPNVPAEIALAYPTGKICEGRFGDRVMYSLVGDRVLFVDLAVGQKINELGVKPRQPFCICKTHSGKKGDSPQWRVWLRDSMGEQPDGTFVVPGNPERVSSAAPAAKAPVSNPALNHDGNGSTNGTNGHSKPPAPADPNIHQGWAQFLLAQTNALVDVYAAALAYSSGKYGNTVKPDDVRSLLTTAYISQCKGGGGPNIA